MVFLMIYLLISLNTVSFGISAQGEDSRIWTYDQHTISYQIDQTYQLFDPFPLETSQAHVSTTLDIDITLLTSNTLQFNYNFYPRDRVIRFDSHERFYKNPL